MTATVVNGLKVVSDQPAASPLNAGRDPSLKPILWIQTRELTLEDGSVVYGCVHCDFTCPRPLGVRPHLRVHKASVPTGPDPVADLTGGSLSLASFAEQIRVLMAQAAESADWRERALEAEGELGRIKRQLGRIGI